MDLPEGLADLEAVMAFDRETCARGLSQYLRPLTPAEVPDEMHPLLDGVTAILVSELASGIRCRQFVTGRKVEAIPSGRAAKILISRECEAPMSPEALEQDIHARGFDLVRFLYPPGRKTGTPVALFRGRPGTDRAGEFAMLHGLRGGFYLHLLPDLAAVAVAAHEEPLLVDALEAHAAEIDRRLLAAGVGNTIPVTLQLGRPPTGMNRAERRRRKFGR